MKIGFSGSPFLPTKIIAIYAVAMTAIAGGILLLPAQPPAPNVAYNLFKVGQTTADRTLIANGWKPVGYACQTATPEQVALGYGSTVCGFSYRTASHNLITAGGIDWLMCSMSRSKTLCSTLANQIALTQTAITPLVADCASGSSACSLSGEITTNGLQRATGTFTPTNDSLNAATSTYTLAKTFTATGTFTNVQASGIFTKASSGTMVFENTFSATNMISGDTLAVTWTVTV
ncbi:MAG: hypothetical protein E6K84_01125 [Thaumarchaeota archaeon]|nr:MAG: hypothetical protein E6K84_01125 [Nitrososphaerota archaeon]